MKKFLREFKEFAMRGNVLDLAIGVIIGGAFQKIVSSLVGDILTPLLGLFGSQDFSAWTLTIGESELKYGAFITTVIDFIFMALIVFLLVKGLNKLRELGKRAEHIEPAPPTHKTCPYCQSEIAVAAVRCPHCTSMLEETLETESDGIESEEKE